MQEMGIEYTPKSCMPGVAALRRDLERLIDWKEKEVLIGEPVQERAGKDQLIRELQTLVIARILLDPVAKEWTRWDTRGTRMEMDRAYNSHHLESYQSVRVVREIAKEFAGVDGELN